MDKRGEMQREWKGKGKEGRMSSTLLHQILENRLRMNEEVRPWLAEVSSRSHHYLISLLQCVDLSINGRPSLSSR